MNIGEPVRVWEVEPIENPAELPNDDDFVLIPDDDKRDDEPILVPA